MVPNSILKLIKNPCQNCNEKIMEIIRIHVSLNGKEPFKFIVKTNVFKGVAGWVRERIRYQKNIENNTKPIPESVTNRC